MAQESGTLRQIGRESTFFASACFILHRFSAITLNSESPHPLKGSSESERHRTATDSGDSAVISRPIGAIERARRRVRPLDHARARVQDALLPPASMGTRDEYDLRSALQHDDRKMLATAEPFDIHVELHSAPASNFSLRRRARRASWPPSTRLESWRVRCGREFVPHFVRCSTCERLVRTMCVVQINNLRPTLPTPA